MPLIAPGVEPKTSRSENIKLLPPATGHQPFLIIFNQVFKERNLIRPPRRQSIVSISYRRPLKVRHGPKIKSKESSAAGLARFKILRR